MSPRRQRFTTIVLMGVAGSGKTSVMAALAERLGWSTLEGDDLHPPSNVDKMAAGIPLTDADRRPWLAAISRWIGERERARSSSIVTCSALKRAYRDQLRAGHRSVWFVHLDAPAPVVAERMTRRAGHFMPPALLESQLATLERLAPDEHGCTLAALDSPDEIADRIVGALRLEPA